MFFLFVLRDERESHRKIKKKEKKIVQAHSNQETD